MSFHGGQQDWSLILCSERFKIFPESLLLVFISNSKESGIIYLISEKCPLITLPEVSPYWNVNQ